METPQIQAGTFCWFECGTTDVDAAKAAKLGATQIVPPTHIPDVGPFSVFADPAGAVIAVVQLR